MDRIMEFPLILKYSFSYYFVWVVVSLWQFICCIRKQELGCFDVTVMLSWGCGWADVDFEA